MVPYFSPRLSQVCLTLTIALSAAAAHATAIIGTVAPDGVISAGTYAADITGMTYISGGTGAAFSGTGILFCDDAFKYFPSNNSVHTYDVVGLAGQMDHASAAARGEDYMNWVFDNYYASIFLTAHGNTNNAGYGFNSVLWEIRHDYDGTMASLSATSGDIYAYEVPAYVDILKNLKTADIAQGYRSTNYTLSFLNDQDTTYQSMVLLTNTPATTNAVPEPSSLALSLLGGLALWSRRRNRVA